MLTNYGWREAFLTAGGTSLSRRRILVGAAAVPMVALLAGAAEEPPSKEVRELLEEALRAIFSDLDAARAVGRVHLAGDPGAAESALRLARVLMAAAGKGPQAVRREIAARREGEWRAGDVVLVGGWVFARSEADLCALALAG